MTDEKKSLLKLILNEAVKYFVGAFCGAFLMGVFYYFTINGRLARMEIVQLQQAKYDSISRHFINVSQVAQNTDIINIQGKDVEIISCLGNVSYVLNDIENKIGIKPRDVHVPDFLGK